MELRFFKKTDEFVDANEEWDGDDGVYFDCDIDDDKIINELVNFILTDNFEWVKLDETKEHIKQTLTNMLQYSETLAAFVEIYKEQLIEVFEEEALKQYDDC